MQIFDQTFVITTVLFWLALFVAVTGILGSMLALQIEKARELATLRAIGVTPGQSAGLILTQTAFIGFVSGIASAPLGLAMAWMLIRVINRRAFGWDLQMQFSPSIVLVAIAVDVIAAFCAGLYPAFRAARARPALAMREE